MKTELEKLKMAENAGYLADIRNIGDGMKAYYWPEIKKAGILIPEELPQ